MLSSGASALLRLGGWTYIPDYTTRQLLGFYHQFLRSRGSSVPQQGTVLWQLHYRIMFAIVVLGFLAYNLFEAARTTPQNFFQILGVGSDANENDLKLAFRAFARRNHPDRVGPEGAPLFIAVRDAYEALKNPITRFAYERFGPDVLIWRDCITPKDYLKRGLMQASGFYIGTGSILILMSVGLKPSPVAFWRYNLLITLFALELFLVLSYNRGKILSYIFPDRVAFQNVLFLHQLFVFLSVALSRVIPVLYPETPSIKPEDPRTYAPFLERLNVLAKAADREISKMLHTELHAMHGIASSVSFSDMKPCEPSDKVIEELTNEMENMILEHQLRVEGPIRPLWETAVQRSRNLGIQKQATYSATPSNSQSSSENGPNNFSQVRTKGNDARLPSPPMSISPEAKHKDFCSGDEHVLVVNASDKQERKEVNLPSPRPSPSPPPNARSRPNSPAGIHRRHRPVSPTSN